jgi:hypothetical protein
MGGLLSTPPQTVTFDIIGIGVSAVDDILYLQVGFHTLLISPIFFGLIWGLPAGVSTT